MAIVRRIIAAITQFVGLLLILFMTVYGGLYAWGWAKTIRFISDQALRTAAELRRQGMALELITPQNIDAIVQVSNWSEPPLWAFIGALSGFLISTAVVGIIFMLAEIAHNTRRTVAFFERVNSRAREV